MNLRDAKKIVLAETAALLESTVDQDMPPWMTHDMETGEEYTPTMHARMQRAVDEVAADLRAKAAK